MTRKKQKLKLIFCLLLGIITTSIYSQVEYTTLSPTITIQAPDSIGTNYHNLDIDGDSIIDYKIGARHFESMEGPHPPYDAYEIRIFGANENTFSIGPYDDNDTIDSTLYFHERDVIIGYMPPLEYIGAWMQKPESFNKYNFIGLRLKINNQFHYGWLYIKAYSRSFSIRSYAFNKTAGQAIITNEPN